MAVTGRELVELELRYAPVRGAAPSVFSPSERIRTDAENGGGDKMGPDRNGYADVYASLLDGLTPQVVVELGVFQGVSMAMWCDLFPAARVVGLDLDFDRFYAHLSRLEGFGAFGSNRPDLIRFDAYGTAALDLAPIGLFVDDGPHTEPAIVNVLRLFGPQMAAGGLYVVEDFAGADVLLADQFPGATIVTAGRLAAARL
jgi:hypothetical protein